MAGRTRNRVEWNNKRNELMERCFLCYADHGLHGTGIKLLANYCGCTSANLYAYFNSVDDIIVSSTEYCMSRVENEFMQIAPSDASDLDRFLREVPYWTAREHGKKYRLMYQVYTHPKYHEYGKKFFEGVDERYTEYAREVAEKIGLPEKIVRPMIFVFVRACVHFALYEDEFYLQEQVRLLRECLALFAREYHANTMA